VCLAECEIKPEIGEQSSELLQQTLIHAPLIASATQHSTLTNAESDEQTAHTQRRPDSPFEQTFAPFIVISDCGDIASTSHRQQQSTDSNQAHSKVALETRKHGTRADCCATPEPDEVPGRPEHRACIISRIGATLTTSTVINTTPCSNRQAQQAKRVRWMQPLSTHIARTRVRAAKCVLPPVPQLSALEIYTNSFMFIFSCALVPIEVPLSKLPRLCKLVFVNNITANPERIYVNLECG
jgi:hypothetical protein